MEQLIRDTLKELKTGEAEWTTRFSEYAEAIAGNMKKLESVVQKFRIRKPLDVYLTLSQTINTSDAFAFSLRYCGQEVAELRANVNQTEVLIDTSKYDARNQKYFQCDIQIHGEPWNGAKARSFRKFFLESDRAGIKVHSKEHEYESMLLTEFSKKEKTQFRGIKPIKIVKARFPMKTPLAASDKNGVKIEKKAGTGGGVDLFTRTVTKGGVRLNVMELKDEYTASEPPEKVIRQAIKYAVFVRQLLRSENGELWWKLFGFKKSLPEKLIINATCIMPINPKGENDTSFACRRLKVEDNDFIELHYIYFDVVNGKITEKESSL